MRINVRKHKRRGYQSIKMSNILEKQFLKQRNDFEKSCVERDKKYHFPQGVIFETDIAYAKDKNKAHRLDRYRPKGKEAQILPVIINVHGGGLLLGNKEFNKYFCALLSKKGFLVYSMEYRLIPDCTFFDQLRDIFLAMDFVKEHAAADGGDLSHVYLVGDSGGACLATYANAIQNSKKIAKAAGVKPSELKVHALGLISGIRGCLPAAYIPPRGTPYSLIGMTSWSMKLCLLPISHEFLWKVVGASRAICQSADKQAKQIMLILFSA